MNGGCSDGLELFGFRSEAIQVPNALPQRHFKGTELEMPQAMAALVLQAIDDARGEHLVVDRVPGILAVLSN